MKYQKSLTLKDGRPCIIRNGVATDGAEALEAFNLAHEQTDYLLTYTDESSMTREEQAAFLQAKTDSPREVELVAEVDGHIVGTAGFEAVGDKEKVKHRAEFGISIVKEMWGAGIGRAMTKACIELAREAEYQQLELDVVADNLRARGLYESLGFVEYGRNPRGFRSRTSGWQELVYMRLELK